MQLSLRSLQITLFHYVHVLLTGCVCTLSSKPLIAGPVSKSRFDKPAKNNDNLYRFLNNSCPSCSLIILTATWQKLLSLPFIKTLSIYCFTWPPGITSTGTPNGMFIWKTHMNYLFRMIKSGFRKFFSSDFSLSWQPKLLWRKLVFHWN